MATKNKSLHGNAPDKSSTALLLIDTINDLEFSDGDTLLKEALPAAHRIAQLKQQAKTYGIPVLYVNDNFGKWQSDFNAQVKHCLQDGVRGEQIVQLLRPDPDDYYVLKPKNSGFFSTSLEILLSYLEVSNLILTGFTTDNCVLFTAQDAYVRDYNLWIPQDCVAAITQEYHEEALGHVERVLKADIHTSNKLMLAKMK